MIGELPDLKGYNAVLVVVDHLSKWIHTIPTVTSLDSAGVAWLFLKHVWHHHGLLEEVISDCRPTVGGITVCYGTCLQSLVLWARVCHCDCIILAFHSTYETWQRLVELGGLTLGFSKVFQISL